MKILFKLVNGIDRINLFLGRWSSLLLIPIACIIAMEVIMRYFFKSPTIWAWELCMQIWAFLVLVAGAYVLLKNAHVRVDVVYNMFNTRVKAILNILTCVLILICMVITVRFGLEIGVESLLKNERASTVWAPPMWTIRMLIPIGGMLMAVQGVSELIKNAFVVFGIEFKSVLQLREEQNS